MEHISITCPFCKSNHKFRAVFPTLPLENTGTPPQSVYTDTTDAMHFKESETSVISASFINRCEECINEFKFAVCVGLDNPRGIKAEKEMAIEFLTGKFQISSMDKIEHDWFLEDFARGTMIGEKALLCVTKPFPIAKFRINDDDHMDEMIESASKSLNGLLLQHLA